MYQSLEINKIMKTYIYFLLLIGFSATAQLNIPKHFSYVEQGFYEQLVFDEEANTTKSLFSTEINPFYLHSYEVSVQDYKQFCDATKRQMPTQPDWSNARMPVVNITYYDTIDYCSWLSKVYNMPFRLPTKTEWEHAARNGEYETNNFIYAAKMPNEFVNYIENTNNKPKCISCAQPNELGLYNMSGNVWEWTLQQLKGKTTLVVGGSFLDDSSNVKVTSEKEFNMSDWSETLGFRILVEAKDFENYMFLEKAQTLLKNAFNQNPPFKVTKEGVFYNNLFVLWNNGYETVSIIDETNYIEFCCWVQDLENPGVESKKPLRIKFDKKNRKQVDVLIEHLNSFYN